MLTPQKTAIVLASGAFTNNSGKTAHGLVRGPSRFKIVGVIDPVCAGQDAGTLLDGQARNIPIFASVEQALATLAVAPDYCVVGLATPGGTLPQDLLSELKTAIEGGLSLVNGLHSALADHPQLAPLAAGREIIDLRKPRSTHDLHFWTGEIFNLKIPRIAVLGMDCSLGKRTTSQLLCAAARAEGLKAEMIYTGQTGWLQGTEFGFIFDATPNDFVSGELEHAILQCAKAKQPDLIFLEGQSALRNPSGPCGAEYLLSAQASGVVLMYAPGRTFYKGQEKRGLRIPPLADEIALIRAYGSKVFAVGVHEEGITQQAAHAAAASIRQELAIPAFLPLRGQAPAMLQAIRSAL